MGPTPGLYSATPDEVSYTNTRWGADRGRVTQSALDANMKSVAHENIKLFNGGAPPSVLHGSRACSEHS